MGLAILGFGWYAGAGVIMALGSLLAVIGALVWVAAMARSDR
jgi:uncharacterized membrane protein YbjE (DUF340 family)